MTTTRTFSHKPPDNTGEAPGTGVLDHRFGFLVSSGPFRGATDRSEQMSGLLGNPLGPLAVMVRLGLIL